MSKKFINAKYFTPQKWEKVHEDNKYYMKEFLDGKGGTLSDKTLIQYTNGLQIFFIWVLENCKNDPFYRLKKRDMLKYQNWMVQQGIGVNGIKFKRSVVSSFCEFIETYYEEEFPTFRNFVKGIDKVTGEKVHKKEPLTLEEMNVLREALAEREKWQELAFLEIAYSTAGRREEIKQLRKEIVSYKPNEKGFYRTHSLRTKGEGKAGKVRELSFSETSKQAIEKWLEVRGEDNCPYIFVSKKDGETRQINETSFNYWCSYLFTKILNKRVHPHLLRSTRATHLVTVEKKDINTAKSLLGHVSSQTTEIYVVRDQTESLGDAF